MTTCEKCGNDSERELCRACDPALKPKLKRKRLIKRIDRLEKDYQYLWKQHLALQKEHDRLLDIVDPAGAAEREVTRQLRAGIAKAEEEQIMFGSGAGFKITGLLPPDPAEPDPAEQVLTKQFIDEYQCPPYEKILSHNSSPTTHVFEDNGSGFLGKIVPRTTEEFKMSEMKRCHLEKVEAFAECCRITLGLAGCETVKAAVEHARKLAREMGYAPFTISEGTKRFRAEQALKATEGV